MRSNTHFTHCDPLHITKLLLITMRHSRKRLKLITIKYVSKQTDSVKLTRSMGLRYNIEIPQQPTSSSLSEDQNIAQLSPSMGQIR